MLTVDDQPPFLEAARALIASTPGFELAGEATSGEEAIAAVDALKPDMVLLDIRMPGLDGIETARRLHDAHAETVVVLVSGHDVADVQVLAEHSGAVAVVLKERLQPALLQSLWARHRGNGAPSFPSQV